VNHTVVWETALAGNISLRRIQKLTLTQTKQLLIACRKLEKELTSSKNITKELINRTH